MSRSKAALRAKYGQLTPDFVGRELGAYLAQISPETWDHYAATGRIPACAPGYPESTPRWFWPDVRRKLLNPKAAEVIVRVDRAALRAGLVADGPAAKNAH